MDRRRFLKLFGLTAGAVVAAPAIAKLPEVKESGHSELSFVEETDYGTAPKVGFGTTPYKPKIEVGDVISVGGHKYIVTSEVVSSDDNYTRVDVDAVSWLGAGREAKVEYLLTKKGWLQYSTKVRI